MTTAFSSAVAAGLLFTGVLDGWGQILGVGVTAGIALASFIRFMHSVSFTRYALDEREKICAKIRSLRGPIII